MTSARRDYERLDPAKVEQTVVRLQARIARRFPDRRLVAVAGEVVALVRSVQDEPAAVHGRVRWVRVAARAASAFVVVATVVALVWTVVDGVRAAGSLRAFEWLPVVESLVNDLVFAAIAVWFLWALPRRLERESILGTLHRMRSIAHIIDMHQLTKDPETVRTGWQSTPASPRRDLSAEQLGQYLDYCSELLSLVSKAAAAFAEHSTDPQVLAAIGDIETLTTGMSRKIWQKISLLHLDPGTLRHAD
jgi:hypothetical protein